MLYRWIFLQLFQIKRRAQRIIVSTLFSSLNAEFRSVIDGRDARQEVQQRIDWNQVFFYIQLAGQTVYIVVINKAVQFLSFVNTAVFIKFAANRMCNFKVIMIVMS